MSYVKANNVLNVGNIIPALQIKDAFVFLDDFSIPQINSDINFWMIRSKGGFFYNEYIKAGFIALGWNYIDKSMAINSQTVEILKDEIRERYGDKRPMYAINKCKKFIEDIKEGDYVIIPDMGSTKIAICRIGEYFEKEIDYKKEIETISKIENREYEINQIECPYKKRRKIEVLLEVSENRIGFNIVKALTSYHGLSDMNNYAYDILNCVYDCYSYKDNVVFALNIGKKEPIKPRELATLMYGITGFFGSIIDEEILSTSLNLNSPGKVVILLKKGFSLLKKKVLPLVGIYIAIVGGSGFGFEFPGLVEFIKEVQTIEIDLEKEKVELDSLYLDNYQKVLEILRDAENEGVDLEEVLKGLETLESLNKTLHFEGNQEFAIEENEVVEVEAVEIDEE